MRSGSGGWFGAAFLAGKAFPKFALLFVLIGLTACAGLPQSTEKNGGLGRDSLDAFMLDGRFSLRHEDKSYSGRLSWRHTEGVDEVLLASPLGQGLAEIISSAAGARLSTSDGRAYAAENVEMLTQQVLGYPLPIIKLADWVRGRSQRGALLESDRFGRPQSLREGDWRIGYEYDSDDPQALPGRLFVEREGVFDLRLRVDEWSELTGLPGKRNSESKP